MCGIIGVCGAAEVFLPSILEGPTRLLEHRGPDDEGYLAFKPTSGKWLPAYGAASQVQDGQPIQGPWSDRWGVVLGHRRLAIIDLTAAGHQPMGYADGRLWIVYNGEIYNYREIRNELQGHGWWFTTDTDTEVILASYAAWGIECLHRFNGMWAFALLDVPARRLLLVRDRFGVKPLYYHSEDGALAFASEIKALLALPGVPRRLHEGRTYDYLMWGILRAGGDTFFEGVSELPAAHYLLVDLPSMSLTLRQYYRLPADVLHADGRREGGARHVAAVRELVGNAVRRRLRADVRIGSCLSGGLDSSSLVGTIAEIHTGQRIEQLGEAPRVYTACYARDPIDESDFARAVVKHTGSVWHRTFPAPRGLWHSLKRLVYIQDEPFGTTSIYAQYCVMERAKETGVTVLLDGQGGDEVFGGYSSCYPAFFFELLSHGHVARLAAEWRLLGHAPLTRAELVRGMGEYLAVRALPTRLKGALARRLRHSGEWLRRDFTEAHRQRDGLLAPRASLSLHALSPELIRAYTLPLLLRYEDRNSMAWSIEARTPFADDHPLIEYVLKAPSEYKIRNGWSKWLLREAMRPVLPECVYTRTDKIGFETPQRKWLAELAGEAKEVLGEERTILQRERLLAQFDRVLASGDDYLIDHVWRLIIFAVWRSTFTV